MSAEVVLHVGMPQAGRVIRHALTRLRPQLRAHGVAYITGSQIERMRHVAGRANGPRAAQRDGEAFERELKALIEAERRHAAGVSGGRSTQIVIAAEDLLGVGALGRRDTPVFRPFAERSVRQVARALGSDDVQVVIHTHRQDRLLELEQLRHVAAGDLMALTERFPYWAQPQLDYCDLVARLRSVPQVTRVTVRPTELLTAGTHAFVNDFLAHLDLRDRLDLYRIGADVSSYPEVLSKRGVELAHAVGPLMTNPADAKSWNQFLQSHHLENSPLTTELFDTATRAEVLDSHRAANRTLFTTLMPDLAPDSYGDDVATYALGNVLPQPRTPESTPLERARKAYEPTLTAVSAKLRRRAGRLLARAR